MNKSERKQKAKHENKILSNQNRFYGKIMLFVLSGAIMIGHGSRMIYQGVFAPGSSYAPNTFDLFFDWLTLAVLGAFIFVFACHQFYTKINTNATYKKIKNDVSEELFVQHPT